MSSHPTRFNAFRRRLTSPALLLLLAPLTVASSLVWAQQPLHLKINGKMSSETPLVVKGKTYISVDALKAAGVVVQRSGETVEISLSPTAPDAAGGSNQQDGIEGKAGAWLFNGIWRFRVISLERADPNKQGTGWLAKMEIRNGSKFGGYAPGGTGWQGVTLVTEDGNAIAAASDASDLRDMGLAQGAGNTQTVFFPTDSTAKVTRLILRFDPKGLEGTPAGLRYTVSNPSFRVDLTGATP